MKIAISYFYQIRNFKKFMIPLSTAMYDPKWYHDFRDSSYVFLDKRKILNGSRCEDLKPGDTCSNLCNGKESCDTKNPNECQFLINYRKQLDKIDFLKFLVDLEEFGSTAQKIIGFEEEPIVVLIVYETPTNSCSERNTIINWFKDNGITLKELDYPIDKNY